jgi:transcriptional regulator with XRE-family HTH domain
LIPTLFWSSLLSKSAKHNAFGRLLKLWRNTRGISQEELSLEVDVSGRHISFLETGRSNPGRSLVIKIADVFKLSPRDRNNLLVAAGFTQSDSESNLQRQHLTMKTLQLSLASIDPTPACASDAYGKIIMVNRGWVKLHQGCANELIQTPTINSYHLYFASNGLRPLLVGWENIACALLMNLQQEVLLTDDARAEEILEQLLAYPDTPENWQQKSDQFGYQHSFRIDVTMPQGEVEELLCINHTVGATPFISDPRIIMSSFHRVDGEPIFSQQQLADINHPLLFSEFHQHES